MSCHKVTGPLDEELLSLLNPRQAAQVRESAGEFDVASYLQSEGGQETLKLTSSQRASIDEAFAKAKHSSDFFRPEFFNRDSDFRWQPKWDPDCPVSSGLEPLDRVGCAKCHNPAGVSQSCLECHNYHIHSKR